MQKLCDKMLITGKCGAHFSFPLKCVIHPPPKLLKTKTLLLMIQHEAQVIWSTGQGKAIKQEILNFLSNSRKPTEQQEMTDVVNKPFGIQFA